MSAKMGSKPSLRLIAVGVFIGVPVLLSGLAVLNLIESADDTLAAAEMQTQLAASDRRLNAPAADGKPVDLSEIYLNGLSRTLASANLQQYVVDTISASSGRLVETIPIDENPDGDAAGGNDIQLKATLDISNEGLRNLLFTLESGLPLLDVETLSVRRLPKEDDAQPSDVLRIDMSVRGKWSRRPT